MSRLRSDSFSPPQPVTPAHLKQESLVHDQKYRGAPKDGYCGKEETIVVNWKEGIVLAAHKYRSNPNAFHPHFKSCKKEVTCKCRTIKQLGKEEKLVMNPTFERAKSSSWKKQKLYWNSEIKIVINGELALANIGADSGVWHKFGSVSV